MSCDHTFSVTVRRQIAGGTLIAFSQCQECGGGRAVSKLGVNLDALPAYDPSISERRYAAQKEEWRLEHEAFEKERQEKTSQWWVDYNAYLNSEHWFRLRRIVLDRDPWCQVCFKNPSNQVHHLSYQSYKQYGFSFAVECIGVCSSCHDILHGKENKDDVA